jgi:hypothetical protein
MFPLNLVSHSSPSSPIFGWLALLYLAKSWVITDGELSTKKETKKFFFSKCGKDYVDLETTKGCVLF